jgi:hypothetical protein
VHAPSRRQWQAPSSARRVVSAAIALLTALAGAGAAEWIVDDNGPADFTTIQAAINAFYVQSGDTIRVRPGLYNGTVYLGSKDLVIRSEAGPFTTILDAQEMGSVVSLYNRTAATRIEGFTLRNGQDQTGGGVYIYGGGPVVTRNIILGNRAVGGYLGYGYGGGIEVYGSAPVITHNVIIGNTALDGGGGIDVYYSGPSTSGTCCPVIAQNTILDNRVTSASGVGGGILAAGAEPRIASCILSGNEAADGGALFVDKMQGIPDAPDVTTNLLFSNLPQDAASNGNFHLSNSNRHADPRLGPGNWSGFWPRSDSPALDSAETGLPAGPDLNGLLPSIDSDLNGIVAGDIGALESRGEITGLALTHDSDLAGSAILTWDDSVNPAVVFNVYASDDDPFRTGGGFCLAAGLTSPTLTDTVLPPRGSIRFYLITGRGSVEGSPGQRGDGTPRPVGGGCGAP